MKTTVEEIFGMKIIEREDIDPNVIYFVLNGEIKAIILGLETEQKE